MRRLLSLGLLIAAAASVHPLSAAEEKAAPATSEQKVEAGELKPPSVPRAAQIEPMVAPVKRSAPQTPASASKLEKAGKPDQASAEKSKDASTVKSAACGSGKKRGDRCVKVAADDQPAKKSKKK